jgi:GT2 family glycosyltransferase
MTAALASNTQRAFREAMDEFPCGQKVTVSFIIPAFNEEQHIGRCLHSIARQDLPADVGAVEIIVVDNQSTDRTAAVSRELGAQVIEVVPGYPSRARNAGVRASKGEWLAFVDADCELAADWLTKCGSHLAANPLVVAAAGTATAPEAESPWVQRAWHGLAHPQQFSDAKQMRWLPTFNLLVCRATFERVGGFDESLATCEDCDLGYKLAEFGHLIIEPRALAAHLGESRSLHQLFRREAWRTRGNARLALSRPFDWSNWLSLLVPPCLVLGFLAAVGGAVAATALHRPIWPWLGLMAAVVGAVVLLVYRKTKSLNPVAIAQQIVVFSVYLAGRSVGLLRSFQRVER